MNTIRSFLFLALSLSTLVVLVNAADDPDISPPDALAWIGAKHTCIESTAYEGKRCFYTYVPECAGEDAPLVFDIHGHSSLPFLSSVYTGWVTKATENCFVLVLPLGTTDTEIADDTCFGFPGGLIDGSGITAAPCCCYKGFQPAVTDDANFLREVAAVIVRDVPKETSNAVTIDTKRIYMAGHSNGCMAAISMATLHSDLVAAVGCHAGTALTIFPDSYMPTPMFMVHGTADRLVPYNGSDDFLSAPSAYALIADANGCTEHTDIRKLDESTNNYTEFTSTSCANNSTVVLFSIDDVGHVPYLGFPAIEEGTLPTKVDTTQLAWDFVKSYSLAVAPELHYEKDEDDISSSPACVRHASIACVFLMLIANLWVLV